MEINTKRLILKPVEVKYAEAIFKYRSDAITNQYQGWIPKTIEDVYEFIRKISPTMDVVNTWFQFVIIIKDRNEIIGDLGIHFLDDEKKQVEIGCTLDKNFQRKGYATETTKEIINFLFSRLNKHRIVGSVDPRNLNSIRLLERLGFRKEAHFKESLFINGEWVDDVIYALLKSEWT